MAEEDAGLPRGLLDDLGTLGFAVTSTDESRVTLTRLALGYHLFLSLESLGRGIWRVGLEMRSSAVPLGRLPEPPVPFALGRFGPSPDGICLELSADDVQEALPSLLEESILPAVDSAPA